jgi:hypothetical protein
VEDWDVPFPFGLPVALESAGSVAAPLLAGFSFALVGLIIPAPEHFRWSSGSLVLLLASGVSFIAAVQCGFWTRQFAVTPEEIELWHPDLPREQKVGLQRLHRRGFKIWSYRFNLSYRTGILLLLAGVTVALVPPGDIGRGRYLAIAVAAAGFLGELCWVLATWVLRGSPTAVYNDQADELPTDGRALWLRRSSHVRRLARVFVPLVRVRVTPSKPSDRGGEGK